MNENKNHSESEVSSNSRRGFALPDWLDTRTLAILTTILTVALALGAMIQTGHSRVWDEITRLRQDVREGFDKVRKDIQALDARLRIVEVDLAAVRERLRAVEVDIAAIRTAMTSFDARLRAVESHTHGDGHWENPTQRDG